MWATRRKVKKVLVKAINATIAPLDSWQVFLSPSASLSKVHLRLPLSMQQIQHPGNVIVFDQIRIPSALFSFTAYSCSCQTIHSSFSLFLLYCPSTSPG
ncbi:hypothetical protein CY35_02G012400 [Sphagnum magellanicum]|nr:hypothetical protein CY35_02G012400 [Sphagnum magellanicum]